VDDRILIDTWFVSNDRAIDRHSSRHLSPKGKTVMAVGNPNSFDLVEITTEIDKVSQPVSGLSGPSGTSNVAFDGSSTGLVANSNGLRDGLAVVKGMNVTYPHNANLGGDHFLDGVAVEP
jgi:hypothetical protein